MESHGGAAVPVIARSRLQRVVRRGHKLPTSLWTHRIGFRRLGTVLATITTALIVVTEFPAAASGNVTGPGDLARTFAAIEGNPRYVHADWGYEALDVKTGKVLGAQNPQKMFDPGSTMKTYSVSTALREYGPNYRFHTPVFRQGTVADGILSGNLILVASGDLSLGLREQPNGTLYYESAPKVDQSYADEGLPGAVEPPGNPLTGLDQLAEMVRATGITRVNGNVVIDDRLFRPYTFPDGLVSSMWVNENLIDLLVTPGGVGQPASVNERPMTASYQVNNQVTTVSPKGSTSLNVTEPTPGTLVVTGTIAAGSPPALQTWNVDDPSAFARTAFVEELQQAGVSVTAAATGPNPNSLLPPRGSLPAGDMIGQYVSAPLSQFATLILKVSYNRGADLMTCLAAVNVGSTNCANGLAAEVETANTLGVPSTSVIPFDGAGSDDQGRTTPAALATFLKNATRTPYGRTLFNAFPLLGRNGTLANVESHSPAAGRAQVKTGNRVVGSPAGQIIVLGNSLAGYAETKGGGRVAFMVAVGNVPIATPGVFETITADQARMVVAIQQDL
jgi:D-alanyl-D-alanine carboxypeptidase/D-alanyl-D-alanine-endopeptidase (penicillin-binding protein 4)